MGLELWSLACGTAPKDLGDLEYLEVKPTGQESYSDNNSEARRVFLLKWDHRASFLDDCLGYATVDGALIARVIPDEHPEVSNFWANSATVEPWGVLGKNGDDGPDWTCAKITVDYRPLPYVVAEDDDDETNELYRYVIRQPQFSAKTLSIQGQQKFSDGVVVPNPPNLIQPEINFQYTWCKVPSTTAQPILPPILGAEQTCIGRVNSEVFDPAGINAPVGTMLFMGVDSKLITPKLAGDNFYYDITFNFSYVNNGTPLSGGGVAGWNYAYRVVDPSTIGYGNLLPPTYQSANLNILFLLS